MGKPLYIDVATGEARIALNGSVNQRLRLFLRDLVPLDIAFIKDGAIVTAAVLADNPGPTGLKVGIRARPGQGDILALATIYSVVGDVARIILNLNTVALLNYFAGLPEDEPAHELFLEVEVANSGLTEIVTYYQAPCIIGREVNVSDDDPPVPAAEADDYVKLSDLAGYVGAEYLNDLLDVDAPAPQDLEHLVYKSGLLKWVPSDVTDGGNF